MFHRKLILETNTDPSDNGRGNNHHKAICQSKTTAVIVSTYLSDITFTMYWAGMSSPALKGTVKLIVCGSNLAERQTNNTQSKSLAPPIQVSGLPVLLRQLEFFTVENNLTIWILNPYSEAWNVKKRIKINRKFEILMGGCSTFPCPTLCLYGMATN